MTKKETGERGEALAANYLEKKGWQIVGVNWHCRYGEIDIIATNADEMLVFVEVRTRDNNEDALASITAKKRGRMIKSAYAYLAAHHLPDDAPWRIDVIAVSFRGEQAEVSHVEDALDW